MTIAIAVRTGSAVVFAADSKVTVSGIVGIEDDGSPRWDTQTYDNANKVVHDQSQAVMMMVAGTANVGRVTVTDALLTRTFAAPSSREEQDGHVAEFIGELVAKKNEYWSTTKIAAEEWPGPTLLIAAPSPDSSGPRVWRARLHGPESVLEERPMEPSIWMEGSCANVFTLLYGADVGYINAILAASGITKEAFLSAVTEARVLRPIDQLSLRHMPTQDAVDLAVFLARVQIEMDRFLPGTPACGGAIDVMVLQMVPRPGIVAYPGKHLHHPGP